MAKQDIIKQWLEINARGREDPVWWIERVLGVRLYEKQRQIVEAIRDHDQVAVRACIGAGKGMVTSCIAIWWVACFNGKVVVTGPQWSQMLNVWWAETRERLANMPIPASNVMAEHWVPDPKKHPKTGIFMVNTKDPYNMQGYHDDNMLFIADEASLIDDAVFNVLEGTQISRGIGGAKELLIGNPNYRTGYFAERFGAPGWVNIHISAMDSPNITGEMEVPGLWSKEAIEQFRERLDPDHDGKGTLWRVQVLGEFPLEDAVNRIVPEAVIERAKKGRPRRFYVNGERTSSVVAGLDIAGYGADATVMTVISNGELAAVEALDGRREPEEIADWVAAKYAEHGVMLLAYDSTGLGWAMGTLFADRRLNTVPVSFAEKPNRTDIYKDLRTELLYGVAEAMRKGWLKIRDRVEFSKLFDDLRGVYYTVPENSRKMLAEKKDETRRRIKRSPDYFDALALAVRVMNRVRTKTSNESVREQFKRAVERFRGALEPVGGF